jgi:MFS family permease
VSDNGGQDESREDEQEGWLTAGVKGIGGASLISDAGHEIPTALLPSLLTSTLGAPAAALGLIEGVSDGLAGLARLGGGALADDPLRRQRVAVGGYSTTAVLSAATGGATAAWQVAVLRAGAWTARGLRVPARNALLADVVPAHAYGRAYGFERAMDNLGAIIGPLLAIGLYVAYNVAATLISVPAGHVGDRKGAPRTLVFGVAAFAVAYTLFAVGPDTVLGLVPAFIAAGLGIGIVETAEHAAVANLAPTQLRGSAIGLLAAVQSGGNLAASAIAGILYTTVSPAWAFGFLAAAMVTATIVLLATSEDRRNRRGLNRLSDA